MSNQASSAEHEKTPGIPRTQGNAGRYMLYLHEN